MFEQHTLAQIFLALMGLSVIMYAILDGYDLGVGMLMPLHNQEQADTMVASIGPFWDANETWLVLAIGILLIAFPVAHSLVLKELYLPAAIMLIGLILRGVAFDFRAKAAFSHKPSWDKAFKFGSWLASLAQGFMLGLFVMSFETSIEAYVFASVSAIGVSAAYCFIGATWLVMKTENELRVRAIKTAKACLVIAFIGIILVSAVNLWLNPAIYQKWLTLPHGLFLMPVPVICAALFALTWQSIQKLEQGLTNSDGIPFVFTVLIFVFSFVGLGLSFYPYIVPNQLTIWETVAAAESLNFLMYGAIIVIPTILAYTAFSYRVFWGKVRELRYY